MNFSRARMDAAATAKSDSALVRWSSVMLRPFSISARWSTRTSANLSESARGHSGRRAQRFSMTLACPQASRRLRLPIFTKRAL